jgi:hypothetical protein
MRWKTIILMLVSLVVFFSACGATPQKISTASVSAHLQIATYSATTTWTVTGSAPASCFDVEADVYCLLARLPLGIHIVRATCTDATRVDCPQGTVLLSGGFQSSQPIGVSHSLSNGWMSASASTSIRVYALCAASHVLYGPGVTSLFNPHSSSRGFAPDGSKVICPAGQVTTGGGFESKDLIVGSEMNGLTFAGWSVAAGGDANVVISAVCVELQG